MRISNKTIIQVDSYDISARLISIDGLRGVVVVCKTRLYATVLLYCSIVL